jgi:uncharacterized protein
MSKTIHIDVAYASFDRQRIIRVQCEAGDTIETVIQRSGILTEFPEIDLTQQKIGIFSKPKQLTDGVNEGDRIEIYRPLTIDPKEARRTKAKCGKR